MNFLLKLFLVSTLSISVDAALVNRGVRVVGTGGGFAEMQAYAFDKSISSLVRFCIDHNEACLLDADEYIIFQNFLLHENSIMTNPLVINTSCNSPFIHKKNGGSASIDSCFLYEIEANEFGPLPKPLTDVATAVLSARLLSLPQEVSENRINGIANKILIELQFENHPVLLSWMQSPYRLNVWNLSIGERQESFLTLEGFEISYDLTREFKKVLVCKDVPEWKLENILVGSVENGISQLKGSLFWNCGDQSFQSVLLIELSFQNEKFIKSRFYILRKERI